MSQPMEVAKDCIDAGVHASNVTAMLDFYENTLGLPKLLEKHVPSGHLHVFGYGRSFVKIVDPTVAASENVGNIYLTFEVSNFDAVYQSLQDAGIHVEVPRTELPPNLVFAIVLDPDGNRIEILERRK